MTETVDVVVIGMGPGGEEVGADLARAGLRVVGIERSLVGGECPYWGCVPSKMMIRAAGSLAEGRRIQALAGSATIDPDWAPVARRIREQATDSWDDRVAVERFERAGGAFVRGSARLAGPGRVAVGDRVFEATRGVVVNPGTSPAIPPIPGIDTVEVWTNREAIETESIPRSLIVLGGGAVGVELAQVFAGFGSEVSVVESMATLVPLEEPEAGDELARVLREERLDVRTGATVVSIAAGASGVRLELEGGEGIGAERLLVATGRRPNFDGLGLASVGLDEQARTIAVDERLRAGDRLWAIGDVTGKGAFTHVAMYQARIVVADILGREHPAADYRALPRVTFTDPEIGASGLTERQAREAGIRVAVGSAPTSTSARGWIHGPGNAGLIKLVADADRGVLVGATAMGPAGGEVMAMLALAIQETIPVERLRHMIYAYPTFHRGVEDALSALSAGNGDPDG